MGRMGKGLWLSVGVLAVLTLQAGAAHAQKKTLVVALNQDPDILDPTLARTYVGRIIFAHMCEKLYEIDEKLNIYPQLAAELPRFTDGSAMTAEAVKYSLDRHREMKGSNRRSELDHVDAVDVVDPSTVRLRLK